MLLVLLCSLSCKPDPKPEPININYENGILISNEGNFQGGNASISFLSRASDTIVNDVFRSELDRPLGDVAQSITVIGNRAYIVVNNSGKIEAVDLPAFTSACTFTGMTSPRYLLPLSSGRALVSNLYSKTIHVVDLVNCTVTSNIVTGGWTEEMLLVGNRVFVTQTGTDKLLVIDAGSLTLSDSMFVGREPNSLVQDRNGKLWVLCGSALGTAIPHLVRVDPDSLVVEASLPFPSLQDAPTKLTRTIDGDSLYFLNGGIFRMAIGDPALPTSAWVPKGSHNWYGLDFDPQTGFVYATDALDYQHKGLLVRLSAATGAELKSWTVGLIPGEMAFLP